MKIGRISIFHLILGLILIGCGGNETDPASASSKVSVPSPKIPQKETSQETEKQIVDEQDIEPQPGKKEIVWQKDGAQMSLIPAGSFEMGDALQEGEKEEQPVHTIELDAFYMDVHEVTMEQWKKFKGGKKLDDWVKNASPGNKHPVVGVLWEDAVAYAKAMGKRLPTEAEWEYAARGGLVGKRFPWGDENLDDDAIPRMHANFDGKGGHDKWGEKTAPVGSFPPNGYGLFDMAGNAFEWTNDWFKYEYYKKSPRKNPTGPKAGDNVNQDKKEHVIRGGSASLNSWSLRVAKRTTIANDTFHRVAWIGFRCVVDVDENGRPKLRPKNKKWDVK